MNDYRNWSSGAEERERKARRTAVIIIGVVFLLLIPFGLVVSVALQKYVDSFDFGSEGGTAADKYVMEEYLAYRMQEIEENRELSANLGLGYDGVWAMTEESNTCIAKKDGKWGMVSVGGEVLIPFVYERFSYMDNTGWVEFEKNGQYHVFDTRGNEVAVYQNKLEFRMESREAYLYRTATAYMSGMKITTIIPEIEDEDFYGIRYCNSKTGQELYAAEGGYEDVGIFTFPDETGRAVAIRGDGWTNTIYYITENGCESRVMELPDGINGRWFDFPGDYTWADISLSNGWLKVYVCDAVPGFLIDEYEYYTAFLNVDTLELVPFPEEYQGAFTIYDMGYGDTMAIRLYNEADEYYRYAICKGSKKLTEEIYYWVEFSEKYMTAGQENGVDILNYEGEVMDTYWDASGTFVNGKMLVCNENGAFFLDENLEACSGYIIEGMVDGCFSRGVIIDDLYYVLDEFAQ